MNPRDLWKPKRPEAKQCASCPFRKDNDAQFGAVLTKLRKKAGIKRQIKPVDIAFARYQVQKDVEAFGDFICHATAYGPKMEPHPPNSPDERQCPGATKYYKELGEKR